MLPLEGVLEYEPALRVRMKAALRDVSAKRSGVWRLKESVSALSQSLTRVAGDLDTVLEHVHAITDNSLSETARTSVDWLDSLAGSFKHASTSLASLVAAQLDEVISEMQEDIQAKKDMQQQAERSLCAALDKFARIPESKASERACFVENASVYEARKAWHAHTLAYCSALNAFDVRQRTLVHPALANLLRIMQQLSSRSLATDRFDDALLEIETDHKTNTAASDTLRQQQQGRSHQLMEQSEPLYYIESDPHNPFQEELPQMKREETMLPLRQYLYHKMRGGCKQADQRRRRQRRPTMLSGQQWALVFCFVTDTHLVVKNADDVQVAAYPIHRCYCTLDDADNRRHVFAIKSKHMHKARALFQAPNSEIRHHWVSRLNELGKTAPPPPATPSASEAATAAFTVRYTNMSSSDLRHDADTDDDSDPDEAHWDEHKGLELRPSTKFARKPSLQPQRTAPVVPAALKDVRDTPTTSQPGEDAVGMGQTASKPHDIVHAPAAPPLEGGTVGGATPTCNTPLLKTQQHPVDTPAPAHASVTATATTAAVPSATSSLSAASISPSPSPSSLSRQQSSAQTAAPTSQTHPHNRQSAPPPTTTTRINPFS
ncbi:hypothetical protein PTSG_05696 [Salpingoeca rosetta]|uniref:PH domain-containing protein n=1 Tax=Salpingoeca rosetta (strain ATCC 50818 / BSB-021) TaxID=946362 RepID=F2UAY6_SALR5|nr:uncharacterized protein PTSG_05696 [Salpingoeca rosetta]EGD73999.1 hypothetical protein PTSG_05696 [Salpingoeca rosetta]|eukprot:XP_004993562.1 hypothetical protein PTSG_05696 [Salpingoeca rosetta]